MVDVKKNGLGVLNYLGWLVIVGVGSLIVTWEAYEIAYAKTILPKVAIAGVELSNLEQEQAKTILKSNFESNPPKVSLTYQGKPVENLDSIKIEPDWDWGVKQAWDTGRSGNLLTRLKERVAMFRKVKNLPLPVKYNQDDLEEILNLVTERIEKKGKPAELNLENGQWKVETGTEEIRVKDKDLREKTIAALSTLGETKIEIPTEVIVSEVDSQKLNTLITALNKWSEKKLRIYYQNDEIFLTDKDIAKLVSLDSKPFNDLALEQLLTHLTQVETEAKNAVFRYENGKVVEFQPEVKGIKVDQDKLKDNLYKFIVSAEKTDFEIPVLVTEPKIKAAEVNNLGINSLIGVGTSEFHHSIPNRIHNLTLASSKLDGAIVAPGETFSVGQTLGEISRATGYREAYVISQGRTVLGDGGGVCQVSTTLFRAALNAGLPIVERKAHAYRVSYYEEDTGPGFDATVFLPSADLKFVNNTPGHILVQTKVDPKNFSMRFELYGTQDGRVATISPAKIYSQTPSKPTVYQEDPTLPEGVTKQIDWSAPGAKVSFDYKVVRGTEVLEDRTFFSTYQPWAAVYLKGTKK